MWAVDAQSASLGSSPGWHHVVQRVEVVLRREDHPRLALRARRHRAARRAARRALLRLPPAQRRADVAPRLWRKEAATARVIEHAARTVVILARVDDARRAIEEQPLIGGRSANWLGLGWARGGGWLAPTGKCGCGCAEGGAAGERVGTRWKQADGRLAVEQ